MATACSTGVGRLGGGMASSRCRARILASRAASHMATWDSKAELVQTGVVEVLPTAWSHTDGGGATP